jgi:YHS domain-containing protein
MYRFLLILGLLTILYFLLRQAVQGFKNKNLDNRGVPENKDQMVEDPECHTFVPRGIAVIEEIGGQAYCFCSKQCAATFRNRQPG